MEEEKLATEICYLYGSETGTAEDIAESLWRESLSNSYKSTINSFSDCDIVNIAVERVIVIIISTTGEGEMPFSVRKTWKWLCRKSLSSDYLKNIKFAVLALGDSSYRKFNFAGKKLFRRFCQLGAHPFIDISLADDQHEFGVDAEFEIFRKVLFKKLPDMVERNEEVSAAVNFTPFPSRYSIFFDNNQEKMVMIDGEKNENSILATVLANDRVTSSDHFQDTRLLSFTCEESVSYKPGDVVMIYPRNMAESISIAIEALGLDDTILDKIICTKSRSHLHPSREYCYTLRDCLYKYFDLQMVPMRSFFRLFSLLSPIEMERERLEELASSEGIDDYIDYCRKSRRTVAEVLLDFNVSAKSIPPERLFDLLKPIRTRAYSITSSPTHHGCIQILAAKIVYKSKHMSRLRRGLCSNFIADLSPGDKFEANLRSGTFKWNTEQESLFIATGTGVAPFRSILFEINVMFPKHPRLILVFGCRSSEKDFYFKDEWSLIKEFQVIPAFSRDKIHTKKYVQDKIRECADLIWNLLSAEGILGVVYIAGRSGNMPNAVVAAIEKIASENGMDGAKFVNTLEATGRIQYETWN